MFRKTSITWEVVSVSEQNINPTQNNIIHYNQYTGVLEAPVKEISIIRKEWLIKKVLKIVKIGNKELPTYLGTDYRLICSNGEYSLTINNEEFSKYINNEWKILSNYDKKDILNDIMPVIMQLINNEVDTNGK